MWMHDWNLSWGGWVLWPLMMVLPLLFWAGIIALIVWAVTRAARPSGHHTVASEGRAPLEIANERYARGEITREQWEQLKRDLSK